jgi:hypothetical protein
MGAALKEREMRLFFMGHRIFGIRPGISLGANDLRKVLAPGASRSNMTGSFVYVIANGIGGHKIGSSVDPIQRISSLQTGSTHELKFAYIGVTPGTGFNIEHAAHDLLNRHRIHNEWFNVPASIAIGATLEAAFRLGEPIQQVQPELVPKILRAWRANAAANAPGEPKTSRTVAAIIIAAWLAVGLVIVRALFS